MEEEWTNRQWRQWTATVERQRTAATDKERENKTKQNNKKKILTGWTNHEHSIIHLTSNPHISIPFKLCSPCSHRGATQSASQTAAISRLDHCARPAGVACRVHLMRLLLLLLQCAALVEGRERVRRRGSCAQTPADGRRRRRPFVRCSLAFGSCNALAGRNPWTAKEGCIKRTLIAHPMAVHCSLLLTRPLQLQFPRRLHSQ